MFVSLLLMVWFAFPGDDPITVPTMTSPKVDNQLSSDEWRGASKGSFSEGGTLRLGADDAHLYLAVHNMPAGEFGFTCVFVYLEDRILVLHASAQLGSAVYVKQGEHWSPVRKDYVWKKADVMWREEHWQAGVNPKGTQEFTVARSVLGENPTIAVGYWVVEKKQQRAIGWPTGLKDSVLDLKLLSGWNPEKLSFQPDTWVQLRLP